MLPDIENLLKLQDADKEIRRLQEEIAELPKRVEAIEQKLAGTKALLHEIQFAEGEIAAAEDKILELMLNTEAREKEVKLAQAELKAETAEIEREKADAHQRTAEDQKQLTEWRAKRDQLRVGIDADLLRHYERVAKFRGTGIAAAFDP